MHGPYNVKFIFCILRACDEDVGSTFTRSVDTRLPNYTISEPADQSLEFSAMLSQISQFNVSFHVHDLQRVTGTPQVCECFIMHDLVTVSADFRAQIIRCSSQ